MNPKKIRFSKSAWIATIVMAMGISGTALADHRHQETSDAYAWGKVRQVTPIYREVRNTTPVHECTQQPVIHTRYTDHGYNPVGGTLAGGILGGIIGNQIGKGRGRKLATAMGTIIGAQIGHDAASTSHGASHSSYTTYNDVCETRQQVSYEQVLDGYRVRYSYRGDEYETVMPYRPGKKIKLRVSVDPVFDL